MLVNLLLAIGINRGVSKESEMMVKIKDVSPPEVSAVVTLLAENRYTQQEITDRMRISQKTQNRIKLSVQRSGEYKPNRKGKSRTMRRLTDMETMNRKLISTQFSHQLKGLGVEVSPVTVRKRLFECALKACRPRKKQKIALVMKTKRLQWAKQVQEWTSEDWTKICSMIW
ncbi:uncharacterized protein LOC126109519 [Schistocerca cancellata]|uniref:uncharacterized protein LOC126109519 n=1 Tax=Schistocerca cancellata TaxID=274614 RepID=UPI00211998F5|nr:uncharacterized protein LOC126109519 [Schistocerca cancellata]